MNISGDPPTNSSQGHFKLTGGHTYHQTGGMTYLSSAVFSGDMVIDGGSFYTAGLNAFYAPPSRLEGNLTIGDALFAPNALIVNGAVHLSPNSRFQTIPQDWNYGYFSVTETFTAGGTLQIEASDRATFQHGDLCRGARRWRGHWHFQQRSPWKANPDHRRSRVVCRLLHAELHFAFRLSSHPF